MKNKAWGGRFGSTQSKKFMDYSASISFDKKLAEYDIQQDIAHARGLCKAKVITKNELARLEKALTAILKEIASGKFLFSAEDEDIHMNIERRLKEKLGKLAGKLHTARSRNDQVITDFRLYVRAKTEKVIALLLDLQKVMVAGAERHIDDFMPAYTHLQQAQPVRIAHWFLAYREMFARDTDRFMDAYFRTNVLPLGSGALAGVNFDTDREYIAKQLGFDSVTQNSIDAVSDRDFAMDFCYAASVLFIHLSRLSEELIIFNSQEFNMIILPDDICTGSSIMPQKKNPDLPELFRGKTGRITGNLLNLFMLVKGLPLAYNKDMQEDKPPVFDSAEQAIDALELAIHMVEGVRFNTELLKQRLAKGFLTAVDVADYLAIKGLPFRKAHHVVGAIVKDCENKGISFLDLSLKELKKHSKLFEDDIFDYIDPFKSPDRKKGRGATSRKEIEAQIKQLKKGLR